jgi:WhiB family redox-sensing transcriptional regulator
MPVRDACLNWALRNNEDSGVWGGLTREERYTLRLNHRH